MKTKSMLISLALALSLGLTLTVATLVDAQREAISAVPRPAAGTLCVAPGGSGCNVAVCGGMCYASVQAAVDDAAPGDEIRIATGTYTGVQARNAVTQVVYISKTVILRGGYSSDLSVWDPDSYASILDAQREGRVIYICDGASPTLEELIITGGDATRQFAGCSSETYPYGCGGGIFVEYSQPIIVSSVITNNVAAATSAGVPTGTSGFGGGIYMIHSDGAVISDSVIISNAASLASRGSGGGLHLRNSDALIESNQILDNIATTQVINAWGAGISVRGSAPTIQSNLLQGNRLPPGTWGQGAGLYEWQGGTTYTISDNVFTGNHGTQAVYLGYSQARFESNLVISNATSAGIRLYDNWPTFSGPILVNNIVARNGDRSLAIYGYSSAPITATLIHNTFVGSGTGEGIYIATDYVNLLMTNNIVADHATGILNTDPVSSTVFADHTLFWSNDQDGIRGTNPVDGNPGFRDPGAGDYHIGPGAAVDAGIVTAEVLDIDGDSRPIGQAPDIGADETALNWIFLPLTLKGN